MRGMMYRLLLRARMSTLHELIHSVILTSYCHQSQTLFYFYVYHYFADIVFV